MRIRKSGKVIISALLTLMLLLQFLPLQVLAQKETEKELTVAVISDIHVIPPSMWADNPDSAAAVSADRKMFAESAAILDAAIADIIREAPDVVLVSGDLTKDGEYESHVYLAEKLSEMKTALPGTSVYVINGNHDINNPHAYDYSSGSGVPTHSATPEEFKEIYEGLGFGTDTAMPCSWSGTALPGIRRA
ncbi:MAG: metallophosphoesterase [Oscillospiraceae bacterium]|nr:metallophosphoesterase [Oscillospiraceae bacterium]